jgi:hypothetical protein
MQQNINIFEQNKIKAEEQNDKDLATQNARLRTKIEALTAFIRSKGYTVS